MGPKFLVAVLPVMLLAPAADAQAPQIPLIRAVVPASAHDCACPPDVAATRLLLDVSSSSGPRVTWRLPADPPPYWYVTFYVPPGTDGWISKSGPVAGHKTEATGNWFNGIRPPSRTLITATVSPAVRDDHYSYQYRRGASVLAQAEVPDEPPVAIPATPGFEPKPDVADDDVTIWWYESARALTYTLQRATTIGPDSDWRTLVIQTGTNYTDWNLPPGRYYYRLRANNHEGSSGWGAATDPVWIE